jgi:hypothetical protein
MCGLWGDDSAYAQDAKAALDRASREALDQQPPAKKLAGLRSEHQTVLTSISHGLQRCDQIEVQMGALQQEYYTLEAALEQRAQRAQDLQVEIDTFEADLPQAAAPGAQIGIRDQLQNLLQAHVRRSGKQFTDSQRKHTCDNIEELLKIFEAAPDDAMEDEDSLPPLSDDERAPKQLRANDKVAEEQADGAADDAEWERGLGAVGKKLVRRGVLGKRTVLQLGAQQAGQGGKAKGKSSTGKGKGKAISYSAAVQAPPPPAATMAYAPPSGHGGAASTSATGLPGVAVPPGGVVPAGGNLTGGWPQLGAASATGAPAAQTPVEAMGYTAHQAQLRRGEGLT